MYLLIYIAHNLKKSKLDGNLLLFFPQNKRSDEYLSRHFIAEGLQQIVDIHKNKKLEDTRKLTIKTLETMYEDEEKPQDVNTIYIYILFKSYYIIY